MLLRLILFIAVIVTFAGETSAQVTNGSFRDGGTGWTVITPLGWTSAFPATGGNPEGYATVGSPTTNSGGRSRLSQTFTTLGESPDSCRIVFDFRVTNTGAVDSSARIICSINNEVFYTSPDIEGAGTPWTGVQFSVPCGELTLELSLQVDAGDNAWQASYDNVYSGIVDPVEGTTWSRIKSFFRDSP